MKRIQYNKIFELYADKPWLLDKKSNLESLFSLCNSEQEENLIYDLLGQFKYIDADVLAEFLDSAVNQIKIGWALDPAKTQVVATAVDDSPDSSQQLLQSLKPVFVKKDWRPARMVNNLNKAKQYVESCPNIVLVDEFAGTGRSLAGRIKLLRQMILDYAKSNKKELPHNIYICVIAAMRNARPIINELGLNYHVVLELSRGISDFYSEDIAEQAIKSMIRIESELDQTILPKNFTEFPSLGWGKAEALYAMETGHIPNSVFPIFWWSKLTGGRNHFPIFDRYEDYHAAVETN